MVIITLIKFFEMKKIINLSRIPGLFLWTALVFMPFSCSKEAVKENPLTDNSSQLIKISGEDAGTATKTTLAGFITSWNATGTADKVGIYCAQSSGGNVNIPYIASSTGVSSAFTGSMTWGTGTHYFYAYYPYNIDYSGLSDVVPISLTASQTQSAGNSSSHLSALDFMVATPVSQAPGSLGASTSVNLRYNHLFTVLEFQIKGSGTLKYVKLTVPTNPIAFSGGTIDITQAPVSETAYTLASLTGTATQCVVMLTNAAALSTTATSVYMVINPGTQTGNCSIGLSSDGTNYLTISKAAPTGGFLRGKKYVVTIEKDQDGNFFSTVTIGTQVWMAENLKTTKYNDNTNIPLVTDGTTWKTLITPGYCWYNNDATTYKSTYGALYNWYAVNTAKLCPTGWHVPSEAEWTTLTDYLGGQNLAGFKLKETGTTHWEAPNTGATNETGFTALPGGYRSSSIDNNGAFYYILTNGFWWSSKEFPTSNAWNRYVSSYDSYFYSGDRAKQYGISVRCVKGETVSDNNGNVYSTVVTSTGKTWLDRNLGATQVATSSTDEAAYGDLYQWGRGSDGHQFRGSGTTTTLSGTDVPVSPDNAKFILAPNTPWDWRSPQKDGLWQGVNGTNNPCPSGFRIPTGDELNNERLSWGSNNAAGAFGSPLKFTVAGARAGIDGSLFIDGSNGHYWSSTVEVGGTGSRYLNFDSGTAGVLGAIRAFGCSVRCIKE